MESRKGCYEPSLALMVSRQRGFFMATDPLLDLLLLSSPSSTFHSGPLLCFYAWFVTVFKIQQAPKFALEATQSQLLSQCDRPSRIHPLSSANTDPLFSSNSQIHRILSTLLTSCLAAW